MNQIERFVQNIINNSSALHDPMNCANPPFIKRIMQCVVHFWTSRMHKWDDQPKYVYRGYRTGFTKFSHSWGLRAKFYRYSRSLNFSRITGLTRCFCIICEMFGLWARKSHRGSKRNRLPPFLFFLFLLLGSTNLDSLTIRALPDILHWDKLCSGLFSCPPVVLVRQ